jgi:hypothetical protein
LGLDAAPTAAQNPGYFQPFQAYASPAFWLTDYIFNAILLNEYEEQQGIQAQSLPRDAAAPAATSGPSLDDSASQAQAPISEDLKEQIAEEVRQQLAQENAAAQRPVDNADINGLERALQPGRPFVVDSPLSAVTPSLQFCDLSPGAVLTLVSVPDDDSGSVELQVGASRGGDCKHETHVVLGFSDLQEMLNALRSQLDTGLQTLRDEQGHHGMPPAPPSAIEPPPHPSEYVATADNDAPAAIQSAQKTADEAESTMISAMFPPGPNR